MTNDPCDNQPTVNIDGRLFLVLHWGADMAREPVNDPCDEWLTDHDRRWTPVSDPRNRHARRSDPDGFYRQIVGRALRPVPAFDERDALREWSLERFNDTISRFPKTMARLADPIGPGVVDPFRLTAECDHHWIEGAEGAFAGLTEHCSHCGLER